MESLRMESLEIVSNASLDFIVCPSVSLFFLPLQLQVTSSLKKIEQFSSLVVILKQLM